MGIIMDLQDKHRPLNLSEIEKIFDARFEESKDEFLEETIKKIENYGAKYDPNSYFSAYDQLQICEAIEEVTPINQEPPEESNDKYNVKCNEPCKREVNKVVNEKVNDTKHEESGLGNINDASKHNIILDLRKCHYRSSLKKIASLLERLFIKWPATQGHWSYIAQNWTPRQINWEISHMVKLHQSGYTIKYPAKFFTYMMQKRKRKKLG